MKSIERSLEKPAEKFTELIRLPAKSNVQCQKVAEEFLAKFTGSGNRIPVNVELAANRAGFSVWPIPHLQSKFGIKATVIKKVPSGTLEILIDEKHYENKFSAPFTIAEEIGHILLHLSLFDNVNNAADRISLETGLDDESHRLYEMQAKRVASCLLLPPDRFKPFILNWCVLNKATIIADDPYNFDMLASFIADQLSSRIDVSVPIITRALTRWTPTPLINEVITALDMSLSPKDS